jgi:hypothetical protein
MLGVILRNPCRDLKRVVPLVFQTPVGAWGGGTSFP